ncbi:MAG: hypothetical protein PV354_12475, partial [Bartonella sp.]|nr:hypothetical protein [Bartonella sp.]
VIYARDAILEKQKSQDIHTRPAVKMPSNEIQDILNLPEDMQREILEVSPSLRQEYFDFMHKIMFRFSYDEYKALDDNNYKELAQSLSVSESKAKQIIKIDKVVEKVYLDIKALSYNLSRNTAIMKAS